MLFIAVVPLLFVASLYIPRCVLIHTRHGFIDDIIILNITPALYVGDIIDCGYV